MRDPAYSLRGHYAGFVSRTIAFLIDRSIVLVLVAIITAVTSYLLQLVGLDVITCQVTPTFSGAACLSARTTLAVFVFAFAPLYTIIFWTLAGQTPGKYFLGLRVYRMDGKPLTLTRSVRRYVGYLLSFLAFGLGFIWIAIDDQRQGFHDIFANTCVVYSWDAFQNQRLINRLSLKINKSRFLQNPEAFYGSGMTEQDANYFTPDDVIAPHSLQDGAETGDSERSSEPQTGEGQPEA